MLWNFGVQPFAGAHHPSLTRKTLASFGWQSYFARLQGRELR
jgi:hypothetical protein